MKEIEDGSITYTFTSPPYNRKRNDKYKNYDDTNPDWFGWNVDVINELLRITTDHIFYNIQPNCYNRGDFYKLVGHFSDKIIEIIVWEKSNPMPASGKAITNAVEYFLVLSPLGRPLRSKTTYTKNHLTTAVNGNMPENHKAVMKQEVADWFFEKFIMKGGEIHNTIVLDPFLGLGTTGISAVKLGVGFVGIEKDEEYFKIAEKRIDEAGDGLKTNLNQSQFNF
jgi:DNA modification methylase